MNCSKDSRHTIAVLYLPRSTDPGMAAKKFSKVFTPPALAPVQRVAALEVAAELALELRAQPRSGSAIPIATNTPPQD